MKNLVVIFGGKSTEHEISILSCMQVMENLDKNKYNIYPIYITKQGEWLFAKQLNNIDALKHFDKTKCERVAILPDSDYLFVKKFGGYKKFVKIDCAFLVMHGVNGEDGTVQGLMELANIPYTSCGVMASSIGMSKNMQKLVFKALDIPTAPYFELTKQEYSRLADVDMERYMFPLVVKPDKLGSSIGISFCKDISELKTALNLAFKFDDVVVIEKAILDMKEINISVLGGDGEILFSETEQPQLKHSILTFADKYLSNQKSGKIQKNGTKSAKNTQKLTKKSLFLKKSKNILVFDGDKNNHKLGTKLVNKSNKLGMANLSRTVPANIDSGTLKLVKDYAQTIFKTLECKGVIRIDFLFDNAEQKLYVNEINTIPGSLAFYLWEYKNLSFTHQLDKIVDLAISTNISKNNRLLTFESHVID